PPALHPLSLHDALPILTRPDEVAGHFDVRFRRSRVPAGMIVSEHDPAAGDRDGRLEHFPWYNDTGIEAPDSDQVMADEPSPGVQDRKSTRLNSSHVSIS